MVEAIVVSGFDLETDSTIKDTDHDSTPRNWALFHGDMDIVAAIDAASNQEE